MADSEQAGYLRGAPSVGLPHGPIIVSGAGGGGVPANGVTGAITDAGSGTALTPKFAFANPPASTTDGTVVAAVATKKIRVLSVAFVAGGTATTLTFNSKPAGAGTAKTCLFANAANGGAVLGYNPLGWFETTAGEGLSATTGAGSATGIQLTYVEV